MGWFRGLGRRTGPRLTWDPESQPRPPSDKWVEKKVRMWTFSNKRNGYVKLGEARQ